MTGRAVLAAAGLVLALGACGSSAKSSTSTAAAGAAETGSTPPTAVPTTAVPTTAAPSAGSPTTAATATTAAATTTSAPPQTETITPATGLTDKQVVHIVAKGFVPGTTYAAVECADKGTATAPGDCDLLVIKVAAADSTGTVTIDFPVQKGPFGDNKVVCSATQKCLISVENAGQATATEVASEDISFAN